MRKKSEEAEKAADSEDESEGEEKARYRVIGVPAGMPASRHAPLSSENQAPRRLIFFACPKPRTTSAFNARAPNIREDTGMSQLKAIIGLGNPGADYDATRHNAGAWLVESLARDHHAPAPRAQVLGLYAKITLAGQDLHLLYPQTFMNKSGGSVAALAKFFKLAPGTSY